MSKIDTTTAAPPVRKSRSLHDIFSGFFLNHVGSSSPTTVGLATPFDKRTENEGASGSPVEAAFGTHFETDDLKLLEPSPDVASIAASSRMRRSETWSSPFQKSILLLPPSSTSDVTTALPDDRSTSGVISFTASGGSDNSIYPGSNLLSFRKSLSDIFNPEKTTISDPRDRSSSTGSSSGVLFDPDPDLDLDTPLSSPDPFSRSRLRSLPSLLTESAGGHVTTSGTETSSPASPKSKPPVRRESMALPAVAEADSSSELQEMNSVDHPGELTYATRPTRTLTRSMSYGGDARDAAASGALAHPEEVIRVPEVRPRRLGILELFERKTVRNKDVNAVAPQSW